MTEAGAPIAAPVGLGPLASAVPGPVEDPLDGAPMLRASYSLLANTVATGVLGLAFWVLAARLFSSVTVGRDTVLLSVMVELSVICQLDLANAGLRFLPDLGTATRRALAAAYAVTATLALFAGTAFVLFAPAVSSSFAFLSASLATSIGFVAALVLWGAFVLQDAALTATRRAPWVPVENGVFGLLKALALPLLLWAGATNAVFLAWVIPLAPLILAVNVFLFARAIPAHTRVHGPAADARSTLASVGLRRAGRFVLRDYLATVLSQATVTALALVVIVILGASDSAFFAIPLSVALAFDTLATGAAGPVLVESTLQRGRLTALVRLFVRRLAGPLIAFALIAALAAPILLAPFGEQYVRHGTMVLRLLLAASALRVLLALFNAVSKAHGRAGRLVVVQLVLFAGFVCFAIPLAHSDGIDGVAAAWLAANVLASVCALGALTRSARAGAPRRIF